MQAGGRYRNEASSRYPWGPHRNTVCKLFASKHTFQFLAFSSPQRTLLCRQDCCIRTIVSGKQKNFQAIPKITKTSYKSYLPLIVQFHQQLTLGKYSDNSFVQVGHIVVVSSKFAGVVQFNQFHKLDTDTILIAWQKLENYSAEFEYPSTLAFINFRYK